MVPQRAIELMAMATPRMLVGILEIESLERLKASRLALSRMFIPGDEWAAGNMPAHPDEGQTRRRRDPTDAPSGPISR